MRKSTFYVTLATQNIRKNRQFYLPYLLACIGTVAMFYILCFITFHDMIDKMPGAGALLGILYLGCVVIALFALVIVLYTNSFVMKRRRRELGLYNILGMEKRHLAKLMLWETLIVAVSSILGGLAAGILLSKLILLALLKLVRFPVAMGFTVSGIGILWTVVLFGVIFLLTLSSNLLAIHRAKPVELLHSTSVGEREPKTKWLLTILGVVTMAAGYTIANVVQSPLEALLLFFVAVLLVIIGTYCLFTAGSIALLKILRKNKGFYYQTKHFTAVSGMLYRMKQNAVGLSNICILATMVLVTVSTTVCLYMGTEDVLQNRFPSDICLTQYAEDGKLPKMETMQTVQQVLFQSGLAMENVQAYTSFSTYATLDGDTFQFNDIDNGATNSRCWLVLLTAEEYHRLTGEVLHLGPYDVLAYSTQSPLPEYIYLEDTAYHVTSRPDQFVLEDTGASVMEVHFLVVAKNEVLDSLYQQMSDSQRGKNSLSYEISFDLDGTDAVKKEAAENIRDALADQTVFVECRQAAVDDFYIMYGGFLFLGLFLGVLFLMATVLIIYYKQLSEGYEDCHRFEILQKVGMSKREVRSTVKAQILLVFFLPLAMAAIHILAAFRMITRLLVVFNLTNIGLFAICTVGTLIMFALIYALVYAATAKVYYHIVGGR